MLLFTDEEYLRFLEFVRKLCDELELEGHSEKRCKLCLVRAFSTYLLELAFNNIHKEEVKS